MAEVLVAAVVVLVYGAMFAHGHIHRGQRIVVDIYFYCYLLYFLETGNRFTINMKFAVFARLASQ